jgi:HEAT repeat protein
LKPDIAEKAKACVPATTDEYIRDFVPAVKELLFQQQTESTDVDNCNRAISELSSACADESAYIDVSLDACLRMGTPAIRHLYHALSLNSNLEYQIGIVATLSDLGPDAIPYLIKIFNEYRELRVDAVMALGDIGGPAAVEFLSKILNAKRSSPRCEGCGYAPIEFYIAQSLGKIGDSAAIPALADFLRDPASRMDVNGRQSVIDALGEIGDPAAIPILREVINSWAPGGVMTEEASDDQRDFELYDVMNALQDIGTEEARDLIRGLQNDQSEEVRTVAGVILRMMASETDN